MFKIAIVKNTILSDVRTSFRAPNQRALFVRVGLDVTPTVTLSQPKTAEETLDVLEEALVLFKRDVALDACSDWYGPECEGTDPETDHVAACIKSAEARGDVIDVKTALSCAGVEANAANIAKFGDCVLVKEDLSKVPRGTLARCAMFIRRGSIGAKSHTNRAWRDRLETWSKQFAVAKDKFRTGAVGEVGVFSAATGPSSSDVEPWVAQYNAFRNQFIAQGGRTSAPGIEAASGFPWGWLVVGVLVVAGAIVIGQLAPVIHAGKAAA